MYGGGRAFVPIVCAPVRLYAEMGVERARRDDERERASKAPGSDGMRLNVCVT